jgi:hypothetical protein
MVLDVTWIQLAQERSDFVNKEIYIHAAAPYLYTYKLQLYI